MTPRGTAAALLVAWLVLPVRALAGPPFATDDPEPVAPRHWEVYLASQASFGEGGWLGSAPHLEVNYGAAPGLQLHVIAPLVLAAGGRSSSARRARRGRSPARTASTSARSSTSLTCTTCSSRPARAAIRAKRARTWAGR